MITFLLLLIMLVGVELLIYSAPTTKYPKPTRAKIHEKKVVNDIYYHSLHFSNEPLPADDTKVKKQMKRILAVYHYNNLQTTILHDKAEKWFPIIKPILESYNIPEDFKYMPLVESGLLSGTSPKGASGHWQFMPQTARDFGLRVNATVDERHEMKKSTIAACKYLKFLYSEFDSWALAAAAYNGGEGRIKRQITRENQNNYFKMNLNRETATYVYRLIAIKEIIENPNLHGYKDKKNTLASRQIF